MLPTLTIFSPAGVVDRPAPLRRAVRRLRGLGFDARLDEGALARHQRFAGDDAARLAALHRVAAEAPSVALASRGGYGLTRLLDAIDWKLIARSVERGTRWVGYSDLTAFQMALLAHTGAASWAGPLAADFNAEDDADIDETTRDCFGEAMRGELQAVGFRTEAGFDGLQLRGPVWGGNLTVLCSLLGTPHFPKIRGGLLVVEDVNEHPYRVERQLLQLQQAGVLDRQRALLIGDVSHFKPSPLDRGYGVRQMVACVRERTAIPVLTGLPMGHGPTKVTLPLGRRVQLLVQRRDVLLGWEHEHEHGHGHEHH